MSSWLCVGGPFGHEDLDFPPNGWSCARVVFSTDEPRERFVCSDRRLVNPQAITKRLVGYHCDVIDRRLWPTGTLPTDRGSLGKKPVRGSDAAPALMD